MSDAPGMLDKTYEFDGLTVFIDQASMLYLDGAEVDYVETLERLGLQVRQPAREVDVRLRLVVQRLKRSEHGGVIMPNSLTPQ